MKTRYYTALFLLSFCAQVMGSTPASLDDKQPVARQVYVVKAALSEQIAIKTFTSAPSQSSAQDEKNITDFDVTRILQQPAHLEVKKRRELDLREFPILTQNKSQLDRFGVYGMQYTDYGVFGESVFFDVWSFKASKNNPMVWLELGAGRGAWPLKVFEYVENPDHTLFVVNDHCEDNLRALDELLSKAPNNQRNKGLSQRFHQVSSDCIEMFRAPQFHQFIPNGADFISALNMIHYCSPRKVIELFSAASAHSKNKGRFYVAHDTNRFEINPEAEQKLFNSIPKKFFDQDPQYFMGFLEAAMQEDDARVAMVMLQLRTIKEGMVQKGFEFPAYVSEEMSRHFTKIPMDFFEPSSDFVEELATSVGFRLVEKTYLFTNCNANELAEFYRPQRSSPKEASTITYVFEKESMFYPTNPRFKNLVRRAVLADQQRKNVIYKHVPYYPFIEERK
ncbi:MAG: hypothetical protein H2057_03620 [Alphaproteobacteria bacterium]|nr:hypothetical protein [Alphaproteobacteria bacterium]